MNHCALTCLSKNECVALPWSCESTWKTRRNSSGVMSWCTWAEKMNKEENWIRNSWPRAWKLSHTHTHTLIHSAKSPSDSNAVHRGHFSCCCCCFFLFSANSLIRAESFYYTFCVFPNDSDTVTGTVHSHVQKDSIKQNKLADFSQSVFLFLLLLLFFIFFVCVCVWRLSPCRQSYGPKRPLNHLSACDRKDEEEERRGEERRDTDGPR